MNILIIDDHQLFRAGMKHLLKGIAGKLDLSEADSLEHITQDVEHTVYDLILLDYFLPGCKGVDALHSVKERFPTSVVVIISSLDDPVSIRQAIEKGAAGFIPKSSSQSVLIGALRLVLAGGIYLPEEAIVDLNIDSSIQSNSCESNSDSDNSALTPRQYEVTVRAVKGMPNKLIAYELDISEGTVKAHLFAAYKTLGVTNRTQAVAAFAQRKLTQ